MWGARAPPWVEVTVDMWRSVVRLRWVVGSLAVITACSTTEPAGLADSNVEANGSSTLTTQPANDSGAAGTSANADDTSSTTAAAGTANPVESSGPELVLDSGAATPETWGGTTSLAEFRNLVVELHGPTDDLPGDFRRLNPFFPADVPTPPGAEVVEVDVRLQSRAEVRSKVTLASSASGEDLVSLFATEFDGAGYEQSGRPTRTKTASTSSRSPTTYRSSSPLPSSPHTRSRSRSSPAAS